MNVNLRKKPRQSGKTEDIIEMAEILLSLGRNIVILIPNRRFLEYLKKSHKEFLQKDSNMLVGVASNLNFLRGHKFDTILVDEWSLTNSETEIKTYAKYNNAVIYATENVTYDTPIFNGNII